MISSKSQLARELSKVKGFNKPKLKLRQYLTPPSIASELLWTAHMNGDLEGEIYDLGCGTGLLAIGAELLGAQVTGFEVDPEAIRIAISNAQSFNIKLVIFEQDIDSITGHCDTIIMNPPFMVKGGKNDQVFLNKAFTLTDTVYSIHTSQTRDWIKKFAEENNFNPTLINTKKFPLNKEFKHHYQEKGNQLVDLWLFHK